MSKSSGFPTALVVLGGIVVVGLLFVMMMVNIFNYGNKMENAIKSSHENMSNVLGQYGLKVAEAAQVPDMYRDDVSRVVGEAIQGRYGENGSQAVILLLREDNSAAKLDSQLYVKIQQIIEAGRNEYQNVQSQFIDLKRGYNTALGSAITGTFLKSFGYPRIDLDQYKIVTTDKAAGELATGRGEALKIRQQ